MKKLFPWLSTMFLSILVVAIFIQSIIINPVEEYNYENIIDSLQLEIDSLKKDNKLIYYSISKLNLKIEKYDLQVTNLNKQLKNERCKTQERADAVDAWFNNDIKWFFEQRYDRLVNDSPSNPNSKIDSKRIN